MTREYAGEKVLTPKCETFSIHAALGLSKCSETRKGSVARDFPHLFLQSILSGQKGFIRRKTRCRESSDTYVYTLIFVREGLEMSCFRFEIFLQ